MGIPYFYRVLDFNGDGKKQIEFLGSVLFTDMQEIGESMAVGTQNRIQPMGGYGTKDANNETSNM